MVMPTRHARHVPLRIISFGNDLDCDCATFLQALKNDGAYEVRIASKQIDRRLTADSKNVTVLQPSSAGEVTDLLAWGPLIGLP